MLAGMRHGSGRNEPAGGAKHAPFGAVLAAYVVASGAAAVWLSPPEAVKAALAVPALAFVPLLVGGAVLRLLPLLEDTPSLDGFGRALVEWLVGSLTLTALAVTLQLSSQAFLLQRFGLVALALALIGPFAMRGGRAPATLSRIGGPGAVAVAAAALLSMTPKIIAARFTPFPLVGGNFLDPLLFAQPALRMLKHGYLELENPSHAPGLVTLVAVCSQLYAADPLSILWTGPFLQLAVFGAGLALWAKAVSGRWTTALLVTAVGLFILTGNSAFSGTPLALRSNRLLFSLFPAALYLTHRLVVDGDAPRRAKVEALVALQVLVGVLFVAMSAYRLGFYGEETRVIAMLVAAGGAGLLVTAAKRRRWGWAGVSPLVLVIVAFQVFHTFEGPVYLTAVIVYGVALALRGLRTEGNIAAAVCLAVTGFFLVELSGIVSFPSGFALSSAIFGSTYESASVDFSTRLALLEDVLSPVIVGLMLVGAAGLMTGRGGPHGRAVVMLAAVMLMVYLLPDALAYRANRGMVPFLAFLVVAGGDSLGALVREAVRRGGSDRPLVQEALQLGLVATALPTLLLPFVDAVSAVRPGEPYNSSVAEVEYALADWFREHTGENVRIISDYQTMLLISSLANKVSLTERRLLSDELSADTRAQVDQIKSGVLRAPNGCSAYHNVRSLAGSEPARERRYLEAIGATGDEPRNFIVWTAKTFVWSRQEDGIEPIHTPMRGDVLPSMVAAFGDPRFFRLVALFGSEAYVFEVLPAPDSAPRPASSEGRAPSISQVLGITSPSAACTAD